MACKGKGSDHENCGTGAPKKMNKITINLIQEEILEEEEMVVKMF